LMVLTAARAISTRAKVVSAMPMRFIKVQLEGLAFRFIGIVWTAKHHRDCLLTAG
jgi:hypothetical protein